MAIREIAALTLLLKWAELMVDTMRFCRQQVCHREENPGISFRDTLVENLDTTDLPTSSRFRLYPDLTDALKIEYGSAKEGLYETVLFAAAVSLFPVPTYDHPMKLSFDTLSIPVTAASSLNATTSHFRRNEKRNLSLDTWLSMERALLESATDPAVQFLELEQLAQLEQTAKAVIARANLSAAEREVYELRQMELTETQISSRLGKSLGTVRTLDQRCKRKLKAAYREYKTQQEAA